MSKRFRNVALNTRQPGIMGSAAEPSGAYRDYSEETQSLIDQEISGIVASRYERVCALLREKKDILEKVAQMLLEIVTLEEKEFKEMVGV
jgi:ATP-dependent Zn protease